MNDDELLRYSRHILLPDIDIKGQERLIASRVLIIGMGGLGSPIALYLAAAGIGQLTLADDDRVELSNLQRQVIHSTDRIGELKVDSAKQAIQALNPTVTVNCLSTRITKPSLTTLLDSIDLVIDATDNFETRFIINEACVETNTAAIFGAAVQLEGQVLVYDPDQDNPCYQCLYGSASDNALNCAENGVAGPVVGVIGTVQAMEAIRLIAGIGRSSSGYLQVFDAKQMEWLKLKLPKNPHCETCS